MRTPFIDDPPDLEASRHIAVSRLRSLESKFAKNPAFASAYRSIIQKYITLGHLEPVQSVTVPDGRMSYLPHHAVTKESSSTTKLRVMFDASVKTSNGKSLNDCQANGPRLQDDISFRSHPVAITAEIEKMYRQIWVHESYRDLQHIV